jgi:uncharacterized protein YkwD
LSRRVRIVIAVASALFSLCGVGGVASAGAAEAAESSELPTELGPCLLWGDLLPVELSRANARKAVLCLINRERAKAGLAPVDEDRRLRRASQRHTATMLRTECVVHRCPGFAVGNPVETLIQEGVYTVDFGMRIG